MLSLEVSDESSVRAAAASVAPRQLYAVVNNAGIGFGHSFKIVFDTNVRGVKHVCDAFLPLLQRDGGRIVMVSSSTGPSCVVRREPVLLQAYRG